MYRLLVYLVTTFTLVMTAWGSVCESASFNDSMVHSRGPTIGMVSQPLEYLVVPGGHELPDLESAFVAGGWQDSHKPTLNLGYQPRGAWVRFIVTNPGLQPLSRLLMVDWAFERIEAWVFNRTTGHWSAPELTGTGVAASRRTLNSPSLGLPVHLPPGDSEVYLRLETTQPMVLAIRLIDPVEFPAEERRESLRQGTFFGAMLIMLLYNASLFIFIRDRSYIYYCGYLLTAAFYVASEFGYGGFFIWAEWPWVASRACILSVSTGFLAVAVFERNFLNIRHAGRLLSHLNSAIVAYWALASVVSMLAPTVINYLAIESAVALSCISSMAIAIVLWRRGSVSAGYFILAWSGLLGTTLCVALAVANILPMESYVRSAQLGGFLLEFLLLSIALAERINREKSSRMQAQAALLSIQEKTNKLLEERVASRTQALEQVNRELVQLSNTDPLTGLNNRRGFEERLHLIIERGRAEGIYIAFLMIDIDYFKRINDAHGHSFGDECLALLGQTLAKFTRRDSEFAARIGGEEFAAALYGVHADNALAVAEQIRAEIAELVVSDTTSMVRFTVSIGVAAWVPGCSDSKITFAKAADEALYLAKARGRNQVCLAQSN